LVEDTTKVGLECFQGGDAVMPGLIPDEVIPDALVVDMASSVVDLNGQGMSGKTMMEDIRQFIIQEEGEASCNWFGKVTLAFLSSNKVVFIPVGHDAIRGVASFCKDINEITR